MELDVVSDVVLHCLSRYSEVEFGFFILNCYSLEHLKCSTKKQVAELWDRILRSNIGNKLRIFSSFLCSLEPEGLISCSKCIACQTSFIEEPHFICEIQAENNEQKCLVVEIPHQNVLADRKISHLEHQVEDLTKQIANLRMQLNNCCSIPSVVVMSGGLPPPPPPMPTFCFVDQMENIKSQINKNKSRSSLGAEGGPTQTSTPLLSLGDIMKGAKNVKLKKTAKSPGGTPIRPPKSIESGTDLSAILARHLKRRHNFLNPCDSPRNNNDSGSDNSWQLSSPECSYGKARRRSKILMLSPLHEVNS